VLSTALLFAVKGNTLKSSFQIQLNQSKLLGYRKLPKPAFQSLARQLSSKGAMREFSRIGLNKEGIDKM